jgi:hypothetical protein
MKGICVSWSWCQALLHHPYINGARLMKNSPDHHSFLMSRLGVEHIYIYLDFVVAGEKLCILMGKTTMTEAIQLDTRPFRALATKSILTKIPGHFRSD